MAHSNSKCIGTKLTKWKNGEWEIPISYKGPDVHRCLIICEKQKQCTGIQFKPNSRKCDYFSTDNGPLYLSPIQIEASYGEQSICYEKQQRDYFLLCITKGDIFYFFVTPLLHFGKISLRMRE